MSSFVGDFICGSRNLITQSMRSLPVIISSALLILGLLQGNLNFLFFFVGMAIIASLASLLVNAVWELIFSNTPAWLTIPRQHWQVDGGAAAQCNLFAVPSSVTGPINVVPTYWTTVMIFFYTYLFLNALFIYQWQEKSNAPRESVSYRKTQSAICMALILAIAVLTLIFRYGTTCEKPLGMMVGAAIAVPLAYGWYTFMRQCGLGTLDDMFGIMNRILPMQSAEDHEPTVCVPTD